MSSSAGPYEQVPPVGEPAVPEGATRTPSATEAPTAAPPAATRPSARRWRQLGITGIALILLGVLGLGIGIGWTARTSIGRPPLPDTTVEVVAAPEGDAGRAATVPDVRGLHLVDAQQAMADAGLNAGAITTVEVPSGQPARSVVRQDPVGGTTGGTAVTLFVAVSGTVPELVGTDSNAAAHALTELGIAVRVVQTYDPAVAEGTVTALDPAAGSPLPAELTLTVAGPASSLFLTDLDAKNSCSTGRGASNGITYEHAVVCGAGTAVRRTTYLVNRLGTTFEGTLGVLDTGNSSFAGTVTLLGDGVVLFTGPARFGVSTPFSVPILGVLELQIDYAAASTGTGTNSSGSVVLGDPRVVGSPESITTLAGS